MRSIWSGLRRHFCAALILLLVASLQLPAIQEAINKWKEIFTSVGLPEDCAQKCAQDCADRCGEPPSFLLSDAPLLFEPNLGQSTLAGDFVAESGSMEIHLTSEGPQIGIGRQRMQARYKGARRTPAEPLDPRDGHVNYLLGNRPERWITDVPTFGKVRYRNVYPGIDVEYHGRGRLLEHDFVVSPGVDASVIRIQFDGVEKMEVADDGSIQLALKGTTISWKRPEIFQITDTGKRRSVYGRYRVARDREAGFEIGEYDHSLPLVIDPVIAYSTYYGRAGSETAVRVATDAAGNVYYTGATSDLVYPRTGGAFQGTPLTGDSNVILTKISADGRTALYTTHFGGSGLDGAAGIALDAAGNIYLAGVTASGDFPATQRIPNTQVSGTNCFVAKLNPAGNALVYSTVLGGSSVEVCPALAVDSSGSAWVAGATASIDFPLSNPIQARLSNASIYGYSVDGVVAKLSPDGASLLFSTYFGGSAYDSVIAIALDSAGNAYITGGTTSTDFAVSTGALQPTFGGRGGTSSATYLDPGDAYVAKISSAGSLVYNTYLGGNRDDVGIAIAVDPQGNAYVTGSTLSPNFPTMSPLQPAYGGTGGERRLASGDAFVSKLNAQGTALVYSTYLGGSQDDRAIGIGLDAAGNAYVTGNTLSPNLRVTSDAAQSAYKAQKDDGFRPATAQIGDAFVAQVGASGTLVYLTYLGGAAADFGAGVAVDSTGGVIVVGGTNSLDFPTTPQVAQSNFGGESFAYSPGGDAFVVRFGALPPSLSISSVESAASYATTAIAPGQIVILKGIGIGPDQLTGLQLDASGVTKILAGTRILFDDTPAPVVYAWKSQSSVIVPYNVAGRATTRVVVEYNGTRSAAISVPVATTVPGLFSADASGRGQGAILNQDNSYNSASNPAPKGSVIQLFGTGEGVTNPAGADGRIASSIFPKPVLPMAVMLGTTRLDTLAYYGAAPSSVAGLFQVNVAIPLDAPSGNVPVQVIVGTAASQTGLTVAIR